MNVSEIFGEGGALSRVIPGYAPRSGQIEFASEIERALAGEFHYLIGEAPTGVGKSAAALAPVIAAGKKALYVTANIALSEQVVYKDFPMIARALSSSATCALAKGLNNYACLDAIEDQRRHATGELERVIDWASMSATGDFSELPFVPEPGTLRLVTRGSDDCIRKACKSYEECFGLKARKLATKADVVVTNYHMLFAHLEILKSGAANGILPDVDVLILDEAHKMADIARGFVGNRTTEYGLRRAIGPLAPSAAQRHARAALDVELHRKVERHLRGVYQRAANIRAGRIKTPGQLATLQTTNLLREVTSVYGETIRSITGIPQVNDSDLFGPSPPRELISWYGRMKRNDEKGTVGYVERLRISGRSCMRGAWALKAADELMDRGEVVHYIEKQKQERNVAICSAPIEVGPYLEGRIWNGEIFRTVVAMSATLRDGATSFEHVVHELGAPEDEVKTIAVESPFDFSRCMLLVDSDWPEPKDSYFAEHLAESLGATVMAAGGRTLALFASNRAMNETELRLCEMVDGKRVMALGPNASSPTVRVLKQGDAPRPTLIKMFKEDETSVLMGVESFWAGVDVPGRALSAVWIEKLPFATPEDPVFDALNEKLGRKAFMTYAVPRAVIQFRQGFGRLIRSMDDAGVVVMADPRIVNSNYGPKFTNVLPQNVLAAQGWDDVRAHLKEYLS